MAADEATLRELLAGYDRDVHRVFSDVLATNTGTERVQSLYQLRRSLAVHDGVVASVLCPLLEELPDGTEVADRLRVGCGDRAHLLHRFGKLVKGVAATNVYGVDGAEIEEIIVDLKHSFEAHEDEETAEVTALLTASSGSPDPEVLATLMALGAGRAPTRSHKGLGTHPRFGMRNHVHRHIDRFRNWSDSHHGWPK